MEENRIKATKEQAERFDFLDAEIEKFKAIEKLDLQDEMTYMEYLQEQWDLKNNYDWEDVVFEENGKKGYKNVKGEIVVPAIFDDVLMPALYYQRTTEVPMKLGDRVGLVKRDGTGQKVTDFEYLCITRIWGTLVDAVWKPEDRKYFALMVMGKVFTPYEIEDFGMTTDGAVPLYADGKMGLLSLDCGLIYIKPEYDEIYDEGVGSDFIFVKDGKKGRVTLDKKFVSDEEFESLSEDEQDELHDAGFICAPDFF